MGLTYRYNFMAVDHRRKKLTFYRRPHDFTVSGLAEV